MPRLDRLEAIRRMRKHAAQRFPDFRFRRVALGELARDCPPGAARGDARHAGALEDPAVAPPLAENL